MRRSQGEHSDCLSSIYSQEGFEFDRLMKLYVVEEKWARNVFQNSADDKAKGLYRRPLSYP